MQNYYLLTATVCVVLLGTVIWLLKKNHLREKYAILWLVIVLAMPIGFLDVPLITWASHFVGIQYPPTMVFLAAILGLLLLTLMLSVIVSHQTDRVIVLTQKQALLEKRISDLEKKQ